MKKNILIISFSNIASDPRVLRQVETLKDDYNITTLGYGELNIEGVKHIKKCIFDSSFLYKVYRFFLLKLGFFEKFYWRKELIEEVNEISKNNFDLILANDILSLPLAVYFKKKNNAKLYYDAHEYAPREFEDVFRWRFLHQKHINYLCEKYLQQVDLMTTVCQGIKKEYEKNYKINNNIHIVMNLPDYQELSPSDIDSNKIRMIHHGGVASSRKIEEMIKLMSYTDERFYLDLMLVRNAKVMEKYYNYLKELAKNNPRINFIDPVPMKNVCTFINNYDIGLYLMNTLSFNNKYCLPNKLFEFIQARLMIAISPCPEMKKIIEKYNLGIVSDNFSPKNLAEKLNALTTEDIQQFKKNSNIAAKELNYAQNAQLIKKFTDKLIN